MLISPPLFFYSLILLLTLQYLILNLGHIHFQSYKIQFFSWRHILHAFILYLALEGKLILNPLNIYSPSE